MKHESNKNKPIVKPKAKTLVQVKTTKKTNSSASKAIGKVAADAHRKTPAAKTKIALKSTPKNSLRTVKKPIKTALPKLSAKTLIALKTIAARKVKLTGNAPEKKIAPKISPEKIKSKASETKQKSSVKQLKKVEKKAGKITATPKPKAKIATAKSKTGIKSINQNSAKATRTQVSKSADQATKTRRARIELSTKSKIKPAPSKAKSIGATAIKKDKKVVQTNLTAAIKSAKREIIATKKIVQNPKKNQSATATKKVEKRTPKAITKTAGKKTVGKPQEKKNILKSTVKPQNIKVEKIVSGRKNKIIEKVLETPEPRPQKPKNRKARPIGAAVFRGKKARYDFKVFALDEKFEPIPAVYIISKRKIDRRKKGHHALVCIGQTDSIFDEIKKHRNGKCVKKHQANVVSILPEADEKTRLRIEIDLKAAHSVACNFE